MTTVIMTMKFTKVMIQIKGNDIVNNNDSYSDGNRDNNMDNDDENNIDNDNDNDTDRDNGN